MGKGKFLLVIFLFASSLLAFSQEFPAKPNRLVNDYTGTFSEAQVQHLERKLVAFDDSTSTQIAVVVIRSVGGYDISDYGVRLAQNWGIGGAENDNGILLLVALGDRRVTIQTGYGVEGAVPDAIAYRIIENEIKPAFRQEDYFTGVDRATDALMAYTKGEYTAPKRANSDHSGVPIVFLLIIIVIIVVIVGKIGGGGDNNGEVMGRRGVSDVFWWTMLSGMGSGGRGRGGFGGGGASGSW